MSETDDEFLDRIDLSDMPIRERERLRAALVEKVARFFAKNDERRWPYFMGTATAAIDLIRAEVLEEAARECERMEKVFAPQQVITDRCAAAIRALKEGN